MNSMNDESINHVDLIKIDTEGAEYDILTSIKKELLTKTSWITGELHGNRDFEFSRKPSIFHVGCIIPWPALANIHGILVLR